MVPRLCGAPCALLYSLYCVAYASGSATTTGATSAACSAALRRTCPLTGAARDASSCEICCGRGQHVLRAASCSAVDCTSYCSSQMPTPSVVDTTTLTGKFMMGFQGWFATPCDGYNVGWSHWSRGNRTPGPDPNLQGFLNFDSWPDMSEFDQDELCPTNLRYANGSIAGLYSNANAKTVARFFRWMAAAGVDGVWRQRFLSDVSSPGHGREFQDKVTQNVAAAATSSGRAWAMMYDISGADPETLVDQLMADWAHLTKDMKILDSDRYLRHRGQPILAIWGLGFKDPKRNIPASTATAIQDYFESANVTLMGGVPTGWRDLTRDSESDPAWAAVYRRFAVISPWTVGRSVLQSI